MGGGRAGQIVVLDPAHKDAQRVLPRLEQELKEQREKMTAEMLGTPLPLSTRCPRGIPIQRVCQITR